MSQFQQTEATWVEPGTRDQVQGYNLEGGMVYVGEGLPFAISPGLPLGKPDYLAGCGFVEELSYRGFSPEGRAGFLGWHAKNRTSPAKISNQILRLFFYGLEHRLFVERDFSETLAAAAVGLLESYRHQFHGLPLRRFLHSWAHFNGAQFHCAHLPLFLALRPGRGDFQEARLAVADLAQAGIPLQAELAYEGPA